VDSPVPTLSGFREIAKSTQVFSQPTGSNRRPCGRIPRFSTSQQSTLRSGPSHYLGLLDIAERFRRRDVSPVEITKDQLVRIDRLDSKLNAYAMILPERALAQVKQAESEIHIW
jgi:hypothetical protein